GSYRLPRMGSLSLSLHELLPEACPVPLMGKAPMELTAQCRSVTPLPALVGNERQHTSCMRPIELQLDEGSGITRDDLHALENAKARIAILILLRVRCDCILTNIERGRLAAKRDQQPGARLQGAGTVKPAGHQRRDAVSRRHERGRQWRKGVGIDARLKDQGIRAGLRLL